MEMGVEVWKKRKAGRNRTMREENIKGRKGLDWVKWIEYLCRPLMDLPNGFPF